MSHDQYCTPPGPTLESDMAKMIGAGAIGFRMTFSTTQTERTIKIDDTKMVVYPVIILPLDPRHIDLTHRPLPPGFNCTPVEWCEMKARRPWNWRMYWIGVGEGAGRMLLLLILAGLVALGVGLWL